MLGSIQGDPGAASAEEGEGEESVPQPGPDARATSAPLSLGTEWDLFPVGYRVKKKTTQLY